jgi:hypothetical protein
VYESAWAVLERLARKNITIDMVCDETRWANEKELMNDLSEDQRKKVLRDYTGALHSRTSSAQFRVSKRKNTVMEPKTVTHVMQQLQRANPEKRYSTNSRCPSFPHALFSTGAQHEPRHDKDEGVAAHERLVHPTKSNNSTSVESSIDWLRFSNSATQAASHPY